MYISLDSDEVRRSTGKTETQTDRQTDRQTQRNIHVNKWTGRHTDTDTDRWDETISYIKITMCSYAISLVT